MNKFLNKVLLHSLLLGSLITSIVVGRYLNALQNTKLDFSALPTNFISNSACFNTKLEHAKEKNRLKQAKLLILGSSVALNNVSGPRISAWFKEPVYNLSSWGLKPRESFEMLKQFGNDLPIKHLIIPFNHTEFSTDAKTIDYKQVHEYFYSEGTLKNAQFYLANFTLDGFIKDWSMRTNYLHRSNVNFSLKFDESGAIVQRPKQFFFAKDGLPLAYQDTTGFQQFTVAIDSIKRFCDARHVTLTLVYLPWRKDILTPRNSKQVESVANHLSARYPQNFVNLSGLPVASQHYFDAGHMFENGATVVTRALLDSITTRRTGAGIALSRDQRQAIVSR